MSINTTNCYVFNRIPKTGSVSANSYLTNLTQIHKLRYYKGHGVSSSQLVNSTCGWVDCPDYISGHLPYSIIEPIIRSKFARSTMTFSILREPIARLTSHIAHFWFELLHCINHDPLIWKCNPEIPIIEDIKNFQVRWLTNARYGPKPYDSYIQNCKLKDLRIHNLKKNTSIVDINSIQNDSSISDSVYLGLLGYKSTDSNLINQVAKQLTHNSNLSLKRYNSEEKNKIKNSSIKFLTELSKACVNNDKELCRSLLINGNYPVEADYLLEKALRVCNLFEEYDISELLNEDLEYWSYCRDLIDNSQLTNAICIKLTLSNIL